MDTSVIDFPALLLATLIAVAITAVLLVAHRGENHRRGWIVAGVLAAALFAIGVIDLLRQSPRETHLAAVVLGVVFPVIGGLGMVRATRRVREWARSLLVFVAVLILFFGGLLLGASVVPRYVPFF